MPINNTCKNIISKKAKFTANIGIANNQFQTFFDGPVKKMLLVRSFLPQPLVTTIDKGFNSFGKLSW